MIPALLLAAAACAVTDPAPAARLAGQGRARLDPARIPLAVAAVAVVAFALDRAGLVIAGATAAGAAVYALAGRRRGKADAARAKAAAEFTGHLADALDAGASPAEAATRAAAHVPENATAQLRRDVTQFAAAANRGAAPPRLETPELERVACLWALSTTRGIPVARLLGLARDEIDAALRHRAATTAALAGPKTTACVLTLLPLGGLGMGAAMGAHPLALLLSPGIGSILLVAGTALTSAGVVASSEIIRRAAA